ncbi:hypothetical protein [Phyllobacterium sp. SYP-B3895]|nr:hypothetical protein [Phyllobacterium sp. SYP-B3895]
MSRGREALAPDRENGFEESHRPGVRFGLFLAAEHGGRLLSSRSI